MKSSFKAVVHKDGVDSWVWDVSGKLQMLGNPGVDLYAAIVDTKLPNYYIMFILNLKHCP